MAAQTISSIKADLYAIANRYDVDVDSFFVGTSDKRFKQTWLDALNAAATFEIDYLRRKQEDEAAEALVHEQELAYLADQHEEEKHFIAHTLTNVDDQATVVEQAVTEDEPMLNIQDKESLATVFLTQVKINGGTTYWFDQVDRSAGYVVGNNTYSYQIPNFIIDNSISYDRMSELLESIAFYFEYTESTYSTYKCDGVGAWLDTDTNTLYLDMVRHITDIGEALDLALENKELAIYDIANQVCLNVHNRDSDRITYEHQVHDYPFTMTSKNFWYTVLDDDGLLDGYVANY